MASANFTEDMDNIQLHCVLGFRRNQRSRVAVGIQYACYRIILVCIIIYPFSLLHTIMTFSGQGISDQNFHYQAPSTSRNCCGAHHYRSCDGTQWNNRCTTTRQLPRAESLLLWILVQLLQRRLTCRACDVLVRSSDVYWFREPVSSTLEAP